MDLKPLAKSVRMLEGAVTFWMMPFVTNPMREKFIAISELVEKEDRTKLFHTFQLFEAFVVDVQFSDASNAHIRAFQMYHERRTDDLGNNLQLYESVISPEMNEVVYQAWEQTREELPKPPGLLAEPAPDSATDPKDSPNIGKKSDK